MKLNRIRLGDYINQVNLKKRKDEYTIDCVRGISTQKKFIDTKADMTGVSLKNYKIVKPFQFAYVPDTSRRGDKISLAFNDTDKTFLVSSISIVFEVDATIINPYYLFMYFNRPEFDRYTRFNSWGSARETFTWEDMCDIKLDLPPIEIQRKYVAIYEGLLANLHSYESKLEELKLVCDGYIEDLRKKYVFKSLFSIMTKRNERNDDLNAEYVGISNNGFIKPKQDLSEGNILNKKKFYKGDFIFTPSGVNLYNNIYNSAVCSHVNEMYYCKDSNVSSNYIELWLKRSEFFRYCDFFNISSVMSNFDGEALKQYKIPIPPLEIQNSIVEVFNVYNERKEYVSRLKNIIKDICPLLVRGAIKEASEVK